MEEFKAKRHAVKKMTRNGLVETDSKEGIVKETAEAKSDEQLGDGPEPAAHGRQDVSAYAAIRCCLLNRFTQNS